MSDKTDPRLDVLRDWLPVMPTVSRPVLLRRVDAADRAAGIVRVDTRDEALVERLAQAMYDGLSKAPNGWPLEETVVRAILAALREAS